MGWDVKMNILRLMKWEYFSWKKIFYSKRIGKTDYNDIKAPLPNTTVLNHGGIGIVINKMQKLEDIARFHKM